MLRELFRIPHPYITLDSVDFLHLYQILIQVSFSPPPPPPPPTGLLPYNFLCVQAGLMLAELRGVAILDPTSIALLLIGAVLLLATGIGMRYLYSKLERNLTR